jgi:hypothetical protein
MENQKALNDYQSWTDKELIDKLLSGDTDAVYYLIMIKYQSFLYSLIGRQLSKMYIKFTNDDLEFRLGKFYIYMTAMTIIKKKNKFDDIKNKDNIKGWLYICYQNFSKNCPEYKFIPLDSDFIDSYPDNSDFDAETESETEMGRNDQILMPKLIAFFKTLPSARDRYIVFTHLYYVVADKKNINLDCKIAAVLQKHGYSTSANDVRRIQCRAYKKAMTYFIKHQ